MHNFVRTLGGCLMAALLASCAAQSARPPVRSQGVSRPVVQPLPAQARRPAYAPAYAPAPAYPAGRAGSESVLKLRAGINVAALSCRGRGMPNVTPAYGSMLNRHKSLFASAYRTETQRLGQSGLDRQQTRLYNRFANQHSPGNFCRSAAYLANQASSMDSPRLASASPQMVAQLEAQLR